MSAVLLRMNFPSLFVQFFFLFSLSILLGCAADTSPRDRISLAGEWEFQLDPDNLGVRENWFENSLEDAVAVRD